MSQPSVPGGAELAAALVALTPWPAAIARDRLMYQAGEAAAKARCRRWLASMGLTTAAALLIAAASVWQGGQLASPAREHVQYVPTPPAPAPAAPLASPMPAEPGNPRLALAGSAAWRLQQALLHAGLDEEPPPAGTTALSDGPSRPNNDQPSSPWEWRNKLLQYPCYLEKGE